MKIDYKGIMQNVVTFKKTGTIAEGDFVKMSSNDTVAKCSDGDNFVGIAVNVNGDLAAVQITGFAEVEVAEAVGTGVKLLSVDDAGKLEITETGRSCLVVNNNTTLGTAVIYFS